MAESGDLSDTAHPGEGPRAADMGDGALVATAGVEEGGGVRSPSVSSALWLLVGSSTRPVEAWPRPSLISMVNVVFILPPGSAALTATGSGALGSSEQATGSPALFSRDLAAKPRPLGPSSCGQL